MAPRRKKAPAPPHKTIPGDQIPGKPGPKTGKTKPRLGRDLHDVQKRFEANLAILDQFSTEKGISAYERNTLKRELTKENFLDAFKECGRVDLAAKSCGTSTQRIYEWIKQDKAFGDALDAAKLQACLALEDEAVRRARYGTEKPIYHHGHVVGAIREYSDVLLIFLLKCWNRARYGDRSQLGVEIPKGIIPLKLSIEDDGEPLEPIEPSEVIDSPELA
jgi:hypothetical protein